MFGVYCSKVLSVVKEQSTVNQIKCSGTEQSVLVYSEVSMEQWRGVV